MSATGSSVSGMIKRFREHSPTSRMERSTQKQDGRLEELWWQNNGEDTGSSDPSPTLRAAPVPISQSVKEDKLPASVDVDDLIAQEIRQLERDIKFSGVGSSAEFSTMGTREAVRRAKTSSVYQSQDGAPIRPSNPAPAFTRPNDSIRASFETLGSREGFHGLCLPEFRLDDGRFDITPIEEEVPRQQKVDPEWANDYCATGKGVNPYSTLHDVQSQINDLLHVFSTKTKELDGIDQSEEAKMPDYITLSTQPPGYPVACSAKDLQEIQQLSEVTSLLDGHMSDYEDKYPAAARRAAEDKALELQKEREKGVAIGRMEERNALQQLDILVPLRDVASPTSTTVPPPAVTTDGTVLGRDSPMTSSISSISAPPLPNSSGAGGGSGSYMTPNHHFDRPVVPMPGPTNSTRTQDEAMCSLDEVLRARGRTSNPTPLVPGADALADHLSHTQTHISPDSIATATKDPYVSVLSTSQTIDVTLTSAIDTLNLQLPLPDPPAKPKFSLGKKLGAVTANAKDKDATTGAESINKEAKASKDRRMALDDLDKKLGFASDRDKHHPKGCSDYELFPGNATPVPVIAPSKFKRLDELFPINTPGNPCARVPRIADPLKQVAVQSSRDRIQGYSTVPMHTYDTSPSAPPAILLHTASTVNTLATPDRHFVNIPSSGRGVHGGSYASQYSLDGHNSYSSAERAGDVNIYAANASVVSNRAVHTPSGVQGRSHVEGSVAVGPQHEAAVGYVTNNLSYGYEVAPPSVIPPLPEYSIGSTGDQSPPTPPVNRSFQEHSSIQSALSSHQDLQHRRSKPQFSESRPIYPNVRSSRDSMISTLSSSSNPTKSEHIKYTDMDSSSTSFQDRTAYLNQMKALRQRCF